MSYRKKMLVLSVLSLVGFLIGVILTSAYGAGLCGEIRYCFDPYDETIGQPLGIFSMVIFILSIIFLFIHEQIFTSWLRFAKYYIPISLVLIFLSPITAVGIGAFDQELVTWWLAGIFFVASIGIIFFKRRSV
jgi:uncharacterized membrane protein required for colicin V production